MKHWWVMFFRALLPFLDHDRQTWRVEMQKQLESSRRQNLIETEYLRHVQTRRHD